MINLNSLSQKENIEKTQNKGHYNTQTPKLKFRRLLEENPSGLLSEKNSEKKFFSDESLNIKYSNKENGIVKAYAAVTDQGLVRNYNEDRVSIVLNILKPAYRSNETWPHCSFFGIYDGHGGSKCADFLRDNLHQFIIRSPSFPFNPSEAIIQGFLQAETLFLASALNSTPKNRSGSCAIIVLIIGESCYVANVGDSRAIMSGKHGTKIFLLSKDHKPSEDQEKKRIIANGGKVYQSIINVAPGQTMPGPFRVFPGKLSVSRTIGDIYAKNLEFDGNPNVVIGVPDLKVFRIRDEHDFIVIGSDGVFDRLSNREIVQATWNQVDCCRNHEIHLQAGSAVQSILNAAFLKKSLDNLTVVFIAFNNFSEFSKKFQR